MSTFFTCSAYMQNFKNIVSTLWLTLSCLSLVKSWNWNFVPMCLILSVLCPISSLYSHSNPIYYIWSVWCPYFPCDYQNFASPLHSFIPCLPLFGYLQSFHFILKMNERMEWKNVIKMIKICQNLVITHIYLHISSFAYCSPYNISPPFWH